MLYTDSEIDLIKRNNELENILPSLGFKLEKHGNDFKTICPLHEDKEPSLIITPSNNLWHCMGCNEGGSIIDFMMKFKNISFLDAVKQLKKENPNSGNLRRSASSKKQKQIPRAKLLERVVQFYQKAFHEDHRGLEYLKSRGIKDPAIFETFRIGFCNGTLFKAIPENGEVIEHLKEIGILQDNNRESFENCVVFPILNETGTVVSIYGRKITDDLYVNHLYLKGSRKGLFNGHVLKSNSEIILTESIIDSLSLYQAGIKNTVPCFGTNGFTAYHLEQLKKNKTKDVIICFDNDESGKKASVALKLRLQDFVFSCEIKELKKAQDLNDFLIQYGKKSLFSFLAATKKENQVPKSPCLSVAKKNDDSLLINFCDRKYIIKGIESSTTRLRANIKAQNCTKFHIDTFDLYSAKARKSFIRDSSILFKEEQEIIEGDVLALINHIEQDLKNKNTEMIQTTNEMSDQARTEALRFGKSKNLVEEILKDIEVLGYLGEEKNKILSYLAMTSRKMNDPLSVMILSASGAGKSALQDTILNLCPKEELMKLTTLTERALFYKEATSLKHKVLALAEEAGAEEASYAIRNLISSKELIIEATVKDSLTGRMTTMQNIVYGPTSVFKTTTNPQTDAETRSRFMILSVDESFEQTRRILNYQRENQTLEGFIQRQKRNHIIRKHHNFQKLLRPLKVFNPYARLLTYQDNKLWARRDNPKYLQIMNAIAFMHQLQRPLKHKNGIEYIEVTLEDIALANDICVEILGRSLDDLSSPARRLFEIIEQITKEKQKQNLPTSLTRREIREGSGWGETYIRCIINELVRMDYLVPVRGSWGKSFKYELAKDNHNQLKQFSSSLINVNELQAKSLKLGLI